MFTKNKMFVNPVTVFRFTDCLQIKYFLRSCLCRNKKKIKESVFVHL